jgi:hypothetical protein
MGRGRATIIANHQSYHNWVVLGISEIRAVSQCLEPEAVSAQGRDKCLDPDIRDVPK